MLVASDVLARHPEDRVLGTVIGGKYAIIDVLGVGGFGCVYEAIQAPVGRPVALKLVHQRHLADEHLRQRFFREAKVVAQLTDPTVVTLYDYGDEPDRGLYMVFELVRGRTLHQVIKSGPQDPFWTAHILVQVLAALEEAHAMGMVHRDIKPGNVMVVEDAQGRQRARLLDFGIAKVVAGGGADENSLETKEGLVLGTPRFMSPEQARGSGEIDARSDLYSLAVLGYAILAGKNPFERNSVIETIMAHVQTPPPPLDPALGVPAGLEAVLRKALEKDPGARYQTAREMASAIHDVFDSVGGSSRSSGPRSSVGGMPLGAAVSGLATPTPAPISSIEQIAVQSPASAYAPTTLTPRPFAGPEAAAAGDLTQAGSANTDQPTGDGPLAPPPPSPKGPIILAVVGLLALVFVGGLYARQNFGSSEAPIVASQLPVAPTSEELFESAKALAVKGRMDDASAALLSAFRSAPGQEEAMALYRRAAEDADLSKLLKKPSLRAFAPPDEVVAEPAPPIDASPSPAPAGPGLDLSKKAPPSETTSRKANRPDRPSQRATTQRPRRSTRRATESKPSPTPEATISQAVERKIPEPQPPAAADKKVGGTDAPAKPGTVTSKKPKKLEVPEF